MSIERSCKTAQKIGLLCAHTTRWAHGSSLAQPTVFFSHSEGHVLPVSASTVEIGDLSYAKMMGRTGIFHSD